MILVLVLALAALCAPFARLRREEGRVLVEFSISRRQRLLYAVFKERAMTAWLKHRTALLVLAFIATAFSLTGPTEPPPNRTVTGFTWISGASPAGYRVWTIDQGGQWHEHYPDGHQAKFFDVTTRGTVDRCEGYITKQSATPFPVVFIPDLGCSDMTVLFVWGQGPWAPLGTMTTISTLPPTEPGVAPSELSRHPLQP